MSQIASYEWYVLNFYDGIVRWTVPVFVMISGTLFLGKNQGIKQLYKKNILRIITAFIFWSALYAFVDLLTDHGGLKHALILTVQGHYHMWFLFMIVGLYMIIPFLHGIIANMNLTRYFLVLSLIFTFILPQIITFISLFSEQASSGISDIWNKVTYHFTLGYVSYFVYGYYLNKIEIKKKTEWLIYLLGILGFAITIMGSAGLSIVNHAADETFFGNFTVNVLLESTAVFVFIKKLSPLTCAGEKTKNILQKLSKYSFGAYLVHAMVIEQLANIAKLHALSFNPVISVLVIGAIVFVVSYAISVILNHIPVLGKYIV